MWLSPRFNLLVWFFEMLSAGVFLLPISFHVGFLVSVFLFFCIICLRIEWHLNFLLKTINLFYKCFWDVLFINFLLNKYIWHSQLIYLCIFIYIFNWPPTSKGAYSINPNVIRTHTFQQLFWQKSAAYTNILYRSQLSWNFNGHNLTLIT